MLAFHLKRVEINEEHEYNNEVRWVVHRGEVEYRDRAAHTAVPPTYIAKDGKYSDNICR